MLNNIEKIEFRSEEVQEILSKTPNWMIRWGNALFLLLVFLVLSISWLIKYPDVIESNAVITTNMPPQKEFARFTGKFDSIYVSDNQIVARNTVLAVLKNSARTEDVYYLKSILDSSKIDEGKISFPISKIPFLLLGEIEEAYASFEDSYSDYQLNYQLKPFNNDTFANEISYREIGLRLENLRSQYKLNKSGLELQKKDFERQKVLFQKGVISQLEFENKQLEIINAEKELKNFGVLLSQARAEYANASKNIRGTEITMISEETRLKRKYFQALNFLKKVIKDWENTYVFKAEIDGTVSFLNYWSSTQTVKEGDQVFSVIPASNMDYIAKIKAAPQNSGKIKIGQRVNISLQNYPETEFGMLQGIVSSISLSPDLDGFYIVNASLNEDLITSYNIEIDFKQEMVGTAEIITEDLRLLERFFYRLKKLI